MPLGIHNPTNSLKPRRGRSWKRARRIELVALLESKFIPDKDIAIHLGLTVQAITAIKNTPEFIARRNELSTGILSQYSQAFAQTEQDARDELEAMVPMALLATKQALLDKTSPHHFKAVQEILDRNSHTSKISRMEHSAVKQIDLDKENKQAQDLLALLRENPEPEQNNSKPTYSPTLGALVETTEQHQPSPAETEAQGEIDLAETEITGPVN